MRILSRYIYSHVIMSTLMVVFVLVGIESFMEFVGQLSDIGVGNYGVWEALMVVPLQLPSNLYQLFPMAGFLGSLIGLGRLASTSQLIVMRAAGVSILQISWSVIKAAILMIIVVTVIGEWIAPHWLNHAMQLKTIAMKKHNEVNQLEGVWLHKDNSYINIGLVTRNSKMVNITRFDFDDQDRLKRVALSHLGKRVNGKWQLYNVKETIFGPKHTSLKTIASEPLGIAFEPKLLKQVKEDVDEESLFILFHNILYREKTGLVSTQYQYAFWKRLIQPITTIVMICLGIPFIFGSLRSSSMGFRVMTGVIIGFGFYMLNQFFGPITLVYQFPPLLAATLPTVLFLIAYVILFRRIT